MIITFRVREEDKEVFVDMILDLELKVAFACLAPLLKIALKKKLGGFVDGIADLKDNYEKVIGTGMWPSGITSTGSSRQ